MGGFGVIGLSPRLKAVARQVLTGQPMADIGTDHAYLPVYLLQRGLVPQAVAADVMPGPLEAARATVAAADLSGSVALRLGDGLRVLVPGEVATATICGMGGPLIATILAAGPLQGIDRLVLQPMGGEERLREWLVGNGWRLTDEQLVADGGRLYVIVTAERGQMAASEVDLLVGPLLRQKRGPLFDQYVAAVAELVERALAGARRSDRPEAQQRVIQLERRLALLKEVAAHGDDR